ncbi:MAG TPA: hypothetical protein DEF85_04295 [Clostridiaceae bacterium]|jgi:hypothetical protein|nr:hypothetical protein [Clostridiaceae bacterium]HBX48094.1 hypothetical protein [Clostridiaceae bacterium]
MGSNFVDIVGYQLEKVHTGMIKWLLEKKDNERFEIIKRIYSNVGRNLDFTAGDICQIKCIPEYSFGRRRKVDLVVEIYLNDNSCRYLVMEMKVDSIPEENQLVGTCNDFIDNCKHTYSNTIFLLLLFGTAQVCLQPPTKNHKFNTLRLKQIISIFGGLKIGDKNYLDWIDSLNCEEDRKSNVLRYIGQSGNPWNIEFLREKGYRLWFPLYYYIYNKMRERSKRSRAWQIYSGSNNAVMNLWSDDGDTKTGWIPKNEKGFDYYLYWEFNNEDFILKIALDNKNKMDKSILNNLRQKIIAICKNVNNYGGNGTQNRYGDYVSVYKWSFNFQNRDFGDIIRTADKIVDIIKPQLEKPF